MSLYLGDKLVSPIVYVEKPPFTGHVDATGLASIGWDEDDIAYLQERVWWNEEDDALYAVNQFDQDAYTAMLDGEWPETQTSGGDIRGIRWFPKMDVYPLNTDFADPPFNLTSYTLWGCPKMTVNNSDELQLVACRALVCLPPMSTTSHYVQLTNAFSLRTFNVSQMTDLWTIQIYNNDALQKIVGLDSIGCARSTSISNNYSLVSIDGIVDCSSCTSLNLSDNYSLAEFRFANVKCNVDLENSYMVSHDSLVYLFEHAQVVTGKTIALGDLLWDKLTDDEIAIATNKGWMVTGGYTPPSPDPWGDGGDIGWE